MSSSFSKLATLNTFVSLCPHAELILRGLELVVQWLSQAQHWLGQARQVKLISGVLTTLTSSHSGPPSLHASCSGPLCCPLVSQSPQFRALTRAAFSKAKPHTLEKWYSIGGSKPVGGAWEGGATH